MSGPSLEPVLPVLVVCLGNICRSPVGAHLLRARGIEAASAGLTAMTGQGADPLAAEVAAAQGLSLAGHVARDFEPGMARAAGLVLVMDAGQRRHIIARAPELAGRVMLFDHWTGARGITDPYRQSRAMHEAVFARLVEGAEAWVARLRR